MTAHEVFDLIKKDVGGSCPFCLSKDHWNFSEKGKVIKFKLWVDIGDGKILESKTGWQNLYDQYSAWRKS